MAGTPSPGQVDTVKTNLKNMQAYNDYVQRNAGAKFLNAFSLLTEKDTSDPGLTLMLNFVESLIKGVASMFGGPIGAFAGTFVDGLVSSWATETPPSLNGEFASYVTRYAATCQQLDLQLAIYHQDPEKYWDTGFTDPDSGQTATVGDLANGDFPAEDDPVFESAAAVSLVQLDQNLWKTMLVSSFQIAHWHSLNGPTFWPGGSENDPPVKSVEEFYKVNPAYYEPWTWQAGTSGCGGKQAGWFIHQYSLGRNASPNSDGALNRDACNYLFSDSVPGVVINPDGLFMREYLFTNMGITEEDVYVDLGAPTAEKVSAAYLRAVKEGRTLSALIAKEGRPALERRIIAKAYEDSEFKRALAGNPRDAIENFLQIKLPEIVAFHVIVEDPRSFGLVVPYPIYGDHGD
jgi:hypothetical protein